MLSAGYFHTIMPGNVHRNIKCKENIRDLSLDYVDFVVAVTQKFCLFDTPIYCNGMMTSSNGDIFHVTGPLCGEFTGHRWIPRTKASDAELWCFLWWMTLKNNRAYLLNYIKLCASFQIHRWIQTGVTVRKRSIQVKINDFLSHVTLKFDGTIGHLQYYVKLCVSSQSHW